MAEFLPAFEKIIKNEGGYLLHKNDGDRGGWTYAGIARNFHSGWDGWGIIDKGITSGDNLTGLVRKFYIENFWNKIKGNDIDNQSIAESIFDFSVNAGIKIGSKLAQLVVGSTPDGFIGTKTLEKLNSIDPEVFVLKYSLSKLARYIEICKRDKLQEKFLPWWCIRILKGLS